MPLRRTAWLMSLILFGACAQDVPDRVSIPQDTASAEPREGAGVGLRMFLGFEGEPAGALEPEAEIQDASGFGNSAVVRYPEQDTASMVLLQVAADETRGSVLKLPEPCDADDPACLRGILEVEPSMSLDVGAADFAFGAHVRLTGDDLRGGDNVVQQGYSTGGAGQWKLQIDDGLGRPECVLVGSGGEQVQKIMAELSVADGAWHSVECRRKVQELSIFVDDKLAGKASFSDTLIISPESPIRVGGKNLKPGSDPYFGELDDIYLEIG